MAAFYADHKHHQTSAKVLVKGGEEDFCALHTLGEVYAVLTGLPLRPRITGANGLAIVRQILNRLSLVSLTE